MHDNRRQNPRRNTEASVELIIGSQVTLKGQLKDISPKSAFIKIRQSVFMQLNDELQFLIKFASQNGDNTVEGDARISRIAPGEGIAVYFTRLEDGSSGRLKELLEKV